jgi:hypothetical protein
MRAHVRWAILVALAALPITSWACPDCQHEVCVGACFCVPDPSCPPHLEIGTSHLFCNIGSKPTIDGKSSCTNCKSQLSGDAGKADCLVRHQGDHVNDGECQASGCYEIR